MLPAFLHWYIWNEINYSIFEASLPFFQKFVYKTIPAVNIYGIRKKYYLPHILNVSLPDDLAIAWFDGEAQHKGEKIGAGGKIMINNNTFYFWTFNCGQGTNTKDELLGAWVSLALAIRLSILVFLLLGIQRL
jgi:hypothetical protein